MPPEGANDVGSARMEHTAARRRFGQYSLVAGGILATTLLGLIAQAQIASFFGTGTRSDALFMARDLAQSGGKLLLPSQAAGVLVPMFLASRRKVGPEAWRPLVAVLSSFVVVAVPIALLVVALAPQLVAVLAPGFDAPTSALTARLLRITAPTIVFATLAALCIAVLQGEERFSRAVVVNAVGGTTMIAGLAVLVPHSGVEGAAVAMLGAAAAQAAVAWAILLAEGMPLVVNPLRHRRHVRGFWSSLAVLAPYGAVVQVSGVVYRISASLLSRGLYTSLSLARQINLALFSLLFMPLNSVLFTSLSRHAAADDDERYWAELRAGARQAVYFVVPVSVATIVLREHAVSLLLERGSFTSTDVRNTALPMAIYAGGLVFTGMTMLLEQAAYARRAQGLVVRANLGIESIQMVLFPILTVTLGVAGIPLASIPAAMFGVAYYSRNLLPARSVHWGAHAPFLWRVGISALCMAVTTVAVASLADAGFDPAVGLPQLVVIVPSAAAGLAVYLGVSLALGLAELKLVLALMDARRRDDA